MTSRVRWLSAGIVLLIVIAGVVIRQAVADPAAVPSGSSLPVVPPVPSASAGPAAAGVPQPSKETWLRPAAAQSDGVQDQVALGHQIIIAALIVIAGVLAAAGFQRFRASRRS